MDLEIGTVWRAAVMTAVGGTVAAVSGAMVVAGAGSSASHGYQMRVAVVTVVILATVVISAGRSVRIGAPRSFAPSVLLGSAIGFVVDPATWGGHAYVAQTLLGAGAPAAVADLVVLLALTALLTFSLGARLLHQRENRTRQHNSYLSEGCR